MLRFRATRRAPVEPPRGRLQEFRARGQVLVLFVLVMLALTGIMALVIDLSWYWANTLRVQRAADAAATAGVIWLPTDPADAASTALSTASANGYTNGSGISVVATVDATNNHELDVTVTAQVQTFFMRIFGIPSLSASRVGHAQFYLPVALGSPQNYYGAGYYSTTTTSTVTTPATAGPKAPATTSPASGQWTNPVNGEGTTVFTTSATTGRTQTYSNFTLGIPAGATITGITVTFNAMVTATSPANCQVGVQLSSNVGAGPWTTAQVTPVLTSTPATGTPESMISPWSLAYTQAQLNANTWGLRIVDQGCSASPAHTTSVNNIKVRVDYTTTTTTTSANTQTDLVAPDGTTLSGAGVANQQGFWATMWSQGAVSINGDAFMPKYEVNPGTLQNTTPGTMPDAYYDYMNYYNYAVEMAPGTTNGQVYVYDPGVCDMQSGTLGTQESVNSYGTNGASAFYDLYDTNNTPYDITDDTLVASSGNQFKDLKLYDPMSSTGTPYTRSGASSCAGLAWHDHWWLLASGLNGGTYGRTYRVHAYSTDCGGATSANSPACSYPSTTTSNTDQNNVQAVNDYTIWATDAGGPLPHVYGVGAMEATFRVSVPHNSSQLATFYIAQVEAAHAGKILYLDLWDPGDTGQLDASLQIMAPTAAGWTPATFNYTSVVGTSASGHCSPTSGNGVTSVVSNTGGSSVFQGCWLRVQTNIPANYAAPQNGWWKIGYNLTNGTGSTQYSPELTTWKVSIVGNPVHLVTTAATPAPTP